MTDLKVDVTNLKKNYGSNQVLKGIDFKVANNEVVVLIGPSGSGKSTLLRCLNKLEEPTSGSIVIDGHDISDPKTSIPISIKCVKISGWYSNILTYSTI